MNRKRFDVKLDAESFNMAKTFSTEWKLPVTKTVRRIIISYAKDYKYKKLLMLIDFLGPVKDGELDKIIVRLSKDPDDELFRKVIVDALRLYDSKRREGF